MHRVAKSSGFTLIELLLAMTFLSILMLTIAMTVIQIGNVYNKGLTLKDVDQAGRSVSDDIRRTLSQSQPFAINDSTFVEVPRPDQNGMASARLCTGLYTYIWNYGQAIADNEDVNNDTALAKYSDKPDEIRLIRIRDVGGEYCGDVTKAIHQGDATELLSAGDHDLAIQSFSISSITSDIADGQALYRIIMEIGTNEKDTLNHDSNQANQIVDSSCKAPSDASSLQNFCSVNQFDFTAQAGDKGGQ